MAGERLACRSALELATQQAAAYFPAGILRKTGN
jgi:hypothetical protein